MHQWDNTIGIEDQSETIGIQYYLNDVYHPCAMPVTDSFAIKFTTSPPLWGVAEYKKNVVPQATMLYEPYPNPSTKYIQIRFVIHDSGFVMENSKLSIYDACGRLVKSFDLESCIVDHVSSIGWDGTDRANRRVASGVYFVRLVAGNHNCTQKVLLIR
jgi:hypothetical protein